MLNVKFGEMFDPWLLGFTEFLPKLVTNIYRFKTNPRK